MENGSFKGQSSKLKEDSAEASYVEVEFSDHGYIFVVANPYRSKDDWILDSGCTYHISSNRNWFSTYKFIEGRVVLTGNDSQSTAIGIGTVELRMHDGTKVTLIDVGHVPDLTKNILISLGTLEAKGCKYSTEDGVLVVAILSCRQVDQEICMSCKEV